MRFRAARRTQMRDRVAKELAMWKQVVKDGNIPQQ